jgi:hypothetical protein
MLDLRPGFYMPARTTSKRRRDLEFIPHASNEFLMPIHLPIEVLISERIALLGLSRADVVRKAGYSGNTSKGMRRLAQLCASDFRSARGLISGLPAALELPPEVVADALMKTAEQIEEALRIEEAEREAAWRRSFTREAWLIGTETVPSSIAIYAVTGGSKRWLRIPLAPPPVTYAAQALRVVRRMPICPFFGSTRGFIVSYAPDFAVRFDLDGNPVEAFDRAYAPGSVLLTIGRRTIPAETLGKIMGAG